MSSTNQKFYTGKAHFGLLDTGAAISAMDENVFNMSNGQSKHANRRKPISMNITAAILSYLKTFVDESTLNWEDKLTPCQYSYNTQVHQSTLSLGWSIQIRGAQ